MFQGRIDWVWPSSGPTNETRKKTIEKERRDLQARIAQILDREADAAAIAPIADLQELLNDESARATENNSKLTTVLAFLPIAASITLALAAIARADLPESLKGAEMGLSAVSAVLTVYVIIQVVCSCHSSLIGLERKHYPYIGPNTVLPAVNESDADFRQRRATEMADAYIDTREANNEKITQMAIAHRALKNAIWGFLALCLVLSCVHLAQIVPLDSAPESKARTHADVVEVTTSIDPLNASTALTASSDADSNQGRFKASPPDTSVANSRSEDLH